MKEPILLATFTTIFWVLIGILLSLVFPIAVKTLQQSLYEKNKLESMKMRRFFLEKIKNAWVQYGGNKYLGIFLSAVLIAVFIVLFLELHFYSKRDAVLAGFAWESLINKIFVKKNI